MEITVKEWIENFKAGKYADKSYETQCDAGWYDWFCKDTSLANKTIKLGNIVKQVVDGGKVNLDTMYVWFKNNCPMVGPLYDDFRFADIESNDVQFTIKVGDEREDHTYTVYGRRNDFKDPLFEADTVKELVAWLNSPWSK